MELELVLALPRSHDASSRRHGFDLNVVASAAAGVLPGKMKKRDYDEAFGSDKYPTATGTTLPLFVWGSASDGEENNNRVDGGLSAKDDHNKFGDGVASPVGWPPVKSAWRNAGGARHVKVKMEGVAIGRKVDLSLHRSYATLLDAVDRLFFTSNNHHEDQEGHRPPAASRLHRTFTYQVGNGDWMLLGDVPWEAFVKSVTRIKIMSGVSEMGSRPDWPPW